MTDISATSFFRQAGLADSGGINFEHEEIDTGGSKRPTKIHLHAVDPASGDRMGTLTYHVPRRKADKILVEHLGTNDGHTGKGVASALMDEMQTRHPGTPIDHGDRTDAGKGWWNKYTDGKTVRRGRTMATLAEKPCPCCRGTGEHDTGFECYHCDGGLTVPADSPDTVACDGHLPDGGHGKTATYAENPLPSELHSWQNTEWDVPHQVDEPIHRGVTIPLSHEDHALVHDHQISASKRAAHIVKLVSKEGTLGRHWTTDPDVASHYSGSSAGEMLHHPHLLAVSLHAHPPAAEHIEHDPVELGRMQVKAHSVEKEIPLKDGAPVRMYGVSWHNPRDSSQSGRYLATAAAKGITRNASAERPEWADGDFTSKSGHTYHTVTEPKAVTMRTPEGRMAGYVNWGDDGVIGNMNVRDEHQRRGIATELLRRAREQRPDLQHSDRLSGDAQAWLKGIGERTAQVASADTPVPNNHEPYQHEHDWLPRDHFFAPGEEGLDPRLFDGERMHPIVRQHILSLLHGFWAPRYGDAWQSWARVYLAGSEASHFYGNGDLDILIGVDYDTARAHTPALAALSDEDISTHLTDELRHGLNDDARMLPGPDGKDTGPWENTWFCNPGSYDIRDIKPYAAYDITRDEWAVKPVEVPADFGPEKLPESTWDVFEAVQKLIGAVQELPEGVREREGAALYDYLHADRHSAFGPEGSGLYDPANAVWKALDKAPNSPLQQLIDWKHAHDGVAAATDQEQAA